MYSFSRSTSDEEATGGDLGGGGLAMAPPCMTMYSSVNGLLPVLGGGVVCLGLIKGGVLAGETNS